MSNIKKRPDGTTTVVLFLTEDEKKRLTKLSKKLDLNEFDTMKYCLRLVSWWSRNEIEPEGNDELQTDQSESDGL